MAIEDIAERRKRIFEAAGIMGVHDLHSALHGEDDAWTEHLSDDGLSSLGEMGIVIHEEERGVSHRVKPSRSGFVFHKKK